MMEAWAPKKLAYDWDNVGLQIGSFQKPVRKVMVTLDVLESVVDEAVEKDVNLIIAHHPFMFKPMKQLNTDSPKGRIIHKLLQNDITVYASHTNLDAASGVVNDMLCDLLGVDDRETLIRTYTEQLYKLAVYVPLTHVDAVRNALSNAGAGHIGNYSHCTFQTEGQGTFKPLEGTDPFIGTQNTLEKVQEVKVETIVEASKLTAATKSMIRAHPYEEVAYDIYPLQNKGPTYGIGRIGKMKENMTLQALCERVKKAYDVPAVRVTGDLEQNIQNVAVLGGSGEKYIKD